MMTLEELRQAYAEHLLTEEEPLMLDNDQTCVYSDGEKVFEMHPDDLLEQALKLLGIPCESV